MRAVPEQHTPQQAIRLLVLVQLRHHRAKAGVGLTDFRKGIQHGIAHLLQQPMRYRGRDGYVLIAARDGPPAVGMHVDVLRQRPYAYPLARSEELL